MNAIMDPIPTALVDQQREFDAAAFDDQWAAPPVLKRYLHLALRWKWVILGTIVTCVALGLVLTLLTAPTYTATSQIEISREQKKITNVEGVDSSQGGQDLEFYETQYALLKAPSLAERVVRTLDLVHADYFFAGSGVKLDPKKFGETKGSPLTQQQIERREKRAEAILLKNVLIEPVRRSRLVKVNYTSENPDLSALIANTWTQQFIKSSMDRNFASTADARRFLEDRLTALKAKLEESERASVTYATNKGIVALETTRDSGGKMVGQRTLAAADLEALNASLSEAISERIAAQSRAMGGGDASPEALGNAAISDLRRQRGEAASDYAKLLVQFDPGYPAARALQEKIRSLDQAISRETSRVSSSRSQAYREAVAKETRLRGEVAKLRTELDTQQRDSIQYGIYQREADTNRQLYDALLQRYKEIGVAGTVGVNNIAIVDRADVPTTPSAPSLPKNIALALLIGIVLAAGLVFALEQVDEGVVNQQQITRVLNLPLLGYTPLTEEALLDELADSKSELAEAYFSIHSNLAFTTPHGFPRSLMVTSTRAGEGKTTTSAALARIIGRTGKTVLLIDADMRSPSIHGLFNIRNKAGLSNLLAGGETLASVVAESPFKGLSILTSGPMPPSPGELLSGDRLKMLIAEMLEHFDHVVIDAPPVLGLTDAPLIGNAVEGCVYVIQAGGVPVRGVRSSLQRLRMIRANIFGAVLTKLNQRDVGYGYGYGYGYGSGYGYGFAERGTDVVRTGDDNGDRWPKLPA